MLWIFASTSSIDAYFLSYLTSFGIYIYFSFSFLLISYISDSRSLSLFGSFASLIALSISSLLSWISTFKVLHWSFIALISSLIYWDWPKPAIFSYNFWLLTGSFYKLFIFYVKAYSLLMSSVRFLPIAFLTALSVMITVFIWASRSFSCFLRLPVSSPAPCPLF